MTWDRSISIDTNALEPNDDPSNVFADKLRKVLDGATIIFPDVVVAEIFAGKAWDKYAIDRMASLYPYRNKVYAGMGLSHMLVKELETGEPVRELRHDPRVTDDLRKAISECAVAPREAARQFARRRHHAVEEMDRRTTEVYDGRQNADDLVKDMRDHLSPAKLQHVCDHPDAFPDLIKSAKLFGLVSSTMRLIKEKKPELGRKFHAERMARTDCLWTRYFIARFAYAVRDHVQSPHMTRSRRRVRSDHNDLEVIAISSHADMLFTNDEKARKIDGMVRDAVQTLLAP